ncbi:hypothetical protein HYO65_gp154 [Tenacibaculum phage PTm1]|uniref:N-acetyltransferase domain-containing protein n=2 Tax=Shirahamavirus PTm1 TaxID=2846435 RepID=A0A5S9HX87_9CAUD|nr:hypothetical protein HYO65_gp154 [Tenacibaculum phage PTm1]BBI90546.1 hypothetical protein [Tenacibaculum phage PTm1]BBI90854.1 hypothetical protein [Tenacibaculum phage PTm5]
MKEMKTICHKAELEWGDVYTFVEVNGTASARAYTFKDGDDAIYLEALYVNDSVRRNGYGKKLQELREELGRTLDKSKSILWVVKGTWQEEWYKRRGYTLLAERVEDSNTIWMSKKI